MDANASMADRPRCPFTTRTSRSGWWSFISARGRPSHRRVVHAADATAARSRDAGRARPRTSQRDPARTAHGDRPHHDGQTRSHPDRCAGACVFDRGTRRVRTVVARAAVLATGGAGKVYRYTSNPDVATGDGIGMAWRAGCAIANMEFVQFHPTCLFHPRAKTLLLTEALRGEGGYLVLENGKRFMPRFDPRAELTPRDIVARAIDHEMKRYGLSCVYLDITHKSRFHPRTLPQRACAMSRLWHRHHPRPHPGRTGGALSLRWYRHRSRRSHLAARPLRHRGGLHRAAWCQPHGEQFPARMPGPGRFMRHGRTRTLDALPLCRTSRPGTSRR